MHWLSASQHRVFLVGGQKKEPAFPQAQSKTEEEESISGSQDDNLNFGLSLLS
jgi:6-phosphogluconolactonase/glucosamine-6-phosphate isomerase/deaminase